MTDLAAPDAATIADAEQRRRVEQLQRRRAARPVADQPSTSSSTELGTPTRPAPRTTSRRSHPAIGARIGAAGLGLVTMLGLVATMGLAQPSAATSVSAPAVTAAPAQVVVVIHRAPTGTVSPTDATTSVAAAPPASPAPAPIALTARPTVKAAAPAQSQAAPAARTHGSR